MTDTVTLPQAMAAQRALRRELDLPDERFPLPAFIGMISDEIEQLRAAGHDDGSIAAWSQRRAALSSTLRPWRASTPRRRHDAAADRHRTRPRAFGSPWWSRHRKMAPVSSPMCAARPPSTT
ncbi:hypothetical protein [Sphingomonas sp.]|uniref:hypothetical protein n=1 Tax=Sphingomonas sp. TaxID=28214 RepID=UPI003CC528E3